MHVVLSQVSRFLDLVEMMPGNVLTQKKHLYIISRDDTVC